MVHVPFCLGAIGVFHSVPAGEAQQKHKDFAVRRAGKLKLQFYDSTIEQHELYNWIL